MRRTKRKYLRPVAVVVKMPELCTTLPTSDEHRNDDDDLFSRRKQGGGGIWGDKKSGLWAED